jgi:hypothetical protein
MISLQWHLRARLYKALIMESVHFDLAVASDLVSAVEREDFQVCNINQMSAYLASANNSNIK